MKISIYTGVRNGLSLDFPIAEMLTHHLPLADEIVVNEGYSEDGTFEKIRDIDPKIRIIRHSWDRSDPSAWHRRFGEDARRACTGDWCIKLDCDEFIPEWEFGRVRELLAQTRATVLPVRFVHFYANYQVVNTRPEKSRWPRFGFRIHRNVADIEVVGDGANIRQVQHDFPAIGDEWIECHHFGAVRHPARLRQKWRNDTAMKRARPGFDWIPRFVFDLFPHNWYDEDFIGDLAPYDGPHVAAVRTNPGRFVRDGLSVLKHVRGRPAYSLATESVDRPG
jgi:hypothetical protein